MPIEDYRLRQRTEEREEQLSPFAMKSKDSRGRRIPEEDDPIRTCFQKDRDRILHSNAFRRLKHKTQVFVMPLGDHYVTRLTHTIDLSSLDTNISTTPSLTSLNPLAVDEEKKKKMTNMVTIGIIVFFGVVALAAVVMMVISISKK